MIDSCRQQQDHGAHWMRQGKTWACHVPFAVLVIAMLIQSVPVASTQPPSGEGVAPEGEEAGGVESEARPSLDACGFASPIGLNDTGAENLTPAVFAEGIADFLVDRAEQEVSRFVLDTVVSELCDTSLTGGLLGPSSVRLDTLFEHTCTLLTDSDASGERTTVRRIGLGTLVRAVQADLRDLPLLIVTQLRTAEPELARTLDAMQALFRGLRDGHQLEDLLYDYDPSHGCDARHTNPRILGYLAQPADEELEVLFRGISVAWYYVQHAPLNGANAADAAGFVRALGEHLEAALASEGLDAFADTAASPPADGNPNGGDEIVQRMRELLAVIQRVNDGVPGGDGVGAVVLASWRLLASALVVPSCETDQDCRDFVGELGPVIEAALEGDFSVLIGTLLGSPYVQAEVGSLDPRLSQILSVASDLASAETSEGVSEALEAFAAPVGSWEHKHDRGGVALTGWAGLQLSYEVPIEQLRSGPAFGPALMLGVDMYAATSDVRGGVFISIIDVGNYATVRLADASSTSLLAVETTGVVDWAQLFAPGLYGFVSLGRSPFVVGAGASFVPDLRRSVDTSGMETRASVFRFGVVLAVDVTIFPVADFGITR